MILQLSPILLVLSGAFVRPAVATSYRMEELNFAANPLVGRQSAPQSQCWYTGREGFFVLALALLEVDGWDCKQRSVIAMKLAITCGGTSRSENQMVYDEMCTLDITFPTLEGVKCAEGLLTCEDIPVDFSRGRLQENRCVRVLSIRLRMSWRCC